MTYRQTADMTEKSQKLSVERTAVVILNWNGRSFLERFLPGLLASIHSPEDEVIIADNASTDGSMEMISERFPKVRTMVFSRNHGFTGGYNLAFERISCRYFLLLNSDIEVPDNWLGPLVRWMDTHPDCGICAPKLHSWQEKDMFEYAGAAGGYIDRLGYPFCRGRIMKKLERDNGQYDTPADVFWVTGACLMTRSEVWKELGGLDPRFFAHMEEIDFCWRAQLAGYRVTVVPESTVWHIGGGTLPQDSPWKLYLNFRNNLMMLDNNLTATYFSDLYSKAEPDNTGDRHIGPKGRKQLSLAEDHRSRSRKIWRQAQRKASCLIFFRMLLDGCSAAVYLVTFRWKYFMSVVKAHRDFRKLRKEKPLTARHTPGNLLPGKDTSKLSGKDMPHVRGICKGWMIPRAMLGIRIGCKE